jgi:hypothetical protein
VGAARIGPAPLSSLHPVFSSLSPFSGSIAAEAMFHLEAWSFPGFEPITLIEVTQKSVIKETKQMSVQLEKGFLVILFSF